MAKRTQGGKLDEALRSGKGMEAALKGSTKKKAAKKKKKEGLLKKVGRKLREIYKGEKTYDVSDKMKKKRKKDERKASNAGY